MWLLVGLIIVLFFIVAAVCGLFLMSRKGKEGPGSIEIMVGSATEDDEVRGSAHVTAVTPGDSLTGTISLSGKIIRTIDGPGEMAFNLGKLPAGKYELKAEFTARDSSGTEVKRTVGKPFEITEAVPEITIDAPALSYSEGELARAKFTITNMSRHTAIFDTFQLRPGDSKDLWFDIDTSAAGKGEKNATITYKNIAGRNYTTGTVIRYTVLPVAPAAARSPAARMDGGQNRTAFISFAHQDKPVADAIVQCLEQGGISCWVAPRDVTPGTPFEKTIMDAIYRTQIFVLVFSSKSNMSPHVLNEVREAWKRGIPIIPFRIEDVPLSNVMNYYISSMHWIDALTPPLDINIHTLLGLIKFLEKPPLLGEKSQPAAKKDKQKDRISKYVPAGNVDNVHFTVTAPGDVLPGEWFDLDVWAHFLVQLNEVIFQAREEYKCLDSTAEVSHRSVGPVAVGRGTVLTVRLKVEKAEVDSPEGTILWAGETGRAGFRAMFPADVKKGKFPGLATIHVEGFQIARLYFNVIVGERGKAIELPLPLERHKKAFVSYASQDRDQVLRAIQGLQKGCPQMEIFMDVLSLRSGQLWEQELWKVIPANDVFYLFWSANARQSPWVEKEWRCALTARGLDFIDPVPLEPPETVPPPLELAEKHFNDWTLAFMRQKANDAS